jgi:hypothetical protein
MMNFDEFLEAAKDRVQETIPDAEVKIQQVNKLQGESYTGISVQPEGAAAAVTFNVTLRLSDTRITNPSWRPFSVRSQMMPDRCLPRSLPFPSQTSRTIPQPRTIS